MNASRYKKQRDAYRKALINLVEAVENHQGQYQVATYEHLIKTAQSAKIILAAALLV